jgi:hypothetical protein
MPMRRFVLLITIIAISVCSSAQASGSSSCQGNDLSKEQLLEVVKTRIRTLGADPGVLDDAARTKVEIDAVDCDYLVRVTSIPEKPGGFTIYRISRAKQILNILPGT